MVTFKGQFSLRTISHQSRVGKTEVRNNFAESKFPNQRRLVGSHDLIISNLLKGEQNSSIHFINIFFCFEWYFINIYNADVKIILLER